ncbi:RICIN domain-containing protein [Rhodococcus marinonascens]|uniref:RICIN domain-containing protein n=1 Tax=Rhodococcus marinonascens TaxID=38311 RepID=UPI0014759CAA|nr:RICIN domain-containing protein [Rhodococcus marinonascens]
MKYDIDIPSGTTFVRATAGNDMNKNIGGATVTDDQKHGVFREEVDGEAPDLLRVNTDGEEVENGTVLRLSVGNITEGTSAAPTGNGPNALSADWGHDKRLGLATPEMGASRQEIDFPAIEVTVMADADATTIEPTLRSTVGNPGDVGADAYQSPKNFFTFQTDHGYEDGHSDGSKIVGNQNFSNHSIRCSPRDTPTSTVNVGGQPLTTIPVLPNSTDDSLNSTDDLSVASIYGLDGRVLDVVDEGTDVGSRIQIWDPHGGPNQKWAVTGSDAFSREIVGSSGMCLQKLNVGSGQFGDDPSADGVTPVELGICSGNQNQQWVFFPEVTDGSQRGGPIVEASTGSRCLEVADSFSANGTPVQLAPCTEHANQLWNMA